jgi:DNA-binding MarR family transcriptional regulator
MFRGARAIPPSLYDAVQTVSRPELLVNNSDREFSRLVLGLFTLRNTLFQIGEKNGASIGLTVIEHISLMVLTRVSSVQDIGVQELANLLRLSGAFMTSTVNGLVEKGLVTKSPHPVDGRRICLRSTERALTLLGELGPVQRQVNDAAFGSLSAAEFRQLCDLVQRLNGSVEQAKSLQDYLLKSQGKQRARAERSGRSKVA